MVNAIINTHFTVKQLVNILFNSTHSHLQLPSEFWEDINCLSRVSVCRLMTNLSSLVQKTAPSSNVTTWYFFFLQYAFIHLGREKQCGVKFVVSRETTQQCRDHLNLKTTNLLYQMMPQYSARTLDWFKIEGINVHNITSKWARQLKLKMWYRLLSLC